MPQSFAGETPVDAAPAEESEPRVTHLSFGRPGRITYLGVSVGDRVRPAQRLASLDCTDVKAELQVAEAELALHRLKATQRRKSPDPADLEIAKSHLELAELDLRIAEARQKRYSSLSQRDGFVSYQDLENADRGLAAAKLSLLLARQGVEKVEHPETSDDQLAHDVEEKIRTARVDQARHQTSLCEITSPIEGTVRAVNRTLGEGVQAPDIVVEVSP